MRPTFETGPIRPPSEAASLLVRCTRNCPWNRCAFCHSYKGEKFSLRPVDEIKADIRAMRACAGAPRSAFLQDADSLVMNAADLCEVLRYLREQFPSVERVTTYARARTVAHKTAAELAALRAAGLDRIHIGMESGSGEVLALIAKGVTPQVLIEAGRKVKAAVMELSMYMMPGIGGRALSHVHAVESARVLCAAGPDFIRLRTVAVLPGLPLHALQQAGSFVKPTDDGIVAEIRLFVERLEGVRARIVSDHILNLLEEVEGDLPGDRGRILALIDRYLALPAPDRLVFKLGRRAGYYHALEDLADAGTRARLEAAMRQMGIASDEDLETLSGELIARYI